MKSVVNRIGIFLIMLVLVLTIPVIVKGEGTEASGKCGDNLYWSLQDGVLTISGEGRMNGYSYSQNVPWYEYRNCIYELNLEEGITLIGSHAFNGCSNLTGDLVIPKSVTQIGGYAFCGCSGFTGELIIPEGVTTILAGTFSGCNGFTGNLVIPEGVTYIGSGAFEGCDGFTGI